MDFFLYPLDFLQTLAQHIEVSFVKISRKNIKMSKSYYDFTDKRFFMADGVSAKCECN